MPKRRAILRWITAAPNGGPAHHVIHWDAVGLVITVAGTATTVEPLSPNLEQEIARAVGDVLERHGYSPTFEEW